MTYLNEKTLKHFRLVMQKNELLIIKFTADWCQPCKTIKPICDEYINKSPSKG